MSEAIMQLEMIFNELGENKYMVLPFGEFERIRSEFETVSERDTLLRGSIWILRRGETFIVAETPRPDEVVLHLVDWQGEARAFVQDRMDAYDRMWDGCGCKIDYYQ